MERLLPKIFPGRDSRRGKRGFTLIEIITASAISLIIIAALLGVTQSILSNFQQIRGGAVREGDAGVALDMLIHDLEALTVSTAPSTVSLQAIPEPVQPPAPPVPLGDIEEDNAVWLTFLTAPVDTDDHQGAARMVSYRLAFRAPPGRDSEQYALYRSLVSAQDTFDALVAGTDFNAYWAANDPVADGNYLVGNMVGLEIRFLRNDTDAWTTSDEGIEIREGVAYVDENNDGTFDPATERVAGGFRSAEVTMTVLDPQGAQFLETGAITLDEAILRFGRTYVRQTAIWPEVN